MPDSWTAIESDRSGEPLPLARDPTQTWVYCSREVWNNHILAHHPEIEDFKDLIVQAIENPIYQDADPEDARVIRYYVDVPRKLFESKHSLLLRVVAKCVYPPERKNERTGLLSSVYLLRKE